MFLYFWLEPLQYDIDFPVVGAGAVGVVVALSAFLMISNVPTYSWKLMSPRRSLRLTALVFVALYIGALLTEPFMTLGLTAVVYVLTIPFSIRSYRKVRRRAAEAQPPRPAETGEGSAGEGTM